jgi:hypothetical protein
MTANTYGSFRYGSGVKYGASPTGLLLWGVTIDWADDGSPTNAAPLMVDMSIRRGRDFFIRLDSQNAATGFQPVRPGTCYITIDDPDLIYDPNNTDSPLFPNVEPGAEMQVFVRVAPDTDIKYLFTGEVIDIQSYYEGNKHMVRITALDDLQRLSDTNIRNAIETDMTASEIVEAILDKIEWPDDRRNIISSDFVVPYWWEERRAFTAINDLAETEGGYFFADAEGKVTYYSQYHTPDLTAEFSEDELLKDLMFSRPWESVRNQIRAVANPISLGDEQDIWQLLDTPILAIGETRTIWASYSVDGLPVSALDVVEPVATTDYTANSQADGLGDDLTGDLTITFTAFGQSARIVIFSEATQPAYITLLKVRGKPLFQNVPVFSELLVPPGNRLFASDTRWRQTSTQANEFVNWASFFLPSRQAYPIIKLENQTDKQFDVELFDRVEVDLPTKRIDERVFAVGGIEHRWLRSNGQAVETILRLEPSRALVDSLELVTAEQSETGTGEHIEFGNIPEISDLPTRTITGWVYVLTSQGPSLPSDFRFTSIMGWQDIYNVWYNKESQSLRIFPRHFVESGRFNTPANSIPEQKWTHFVVVHDRSVDITTTPTIYINGAEVVVTVVTAPQDVANSEANTLFSLGNFYHPTVPYTRQFHGLYRDMRVYNRALTAQEALDVYNGDPVDDGLLFQAPAIPTDARDQYIDQSLGTKLCYDLVKGRPGSTATSPLPFIREYNFRDYIPLYSATFTAADSTLIQNYTPEIGEPMLQSAPDPSKSNMIISGNRATSAGANVAGATGQFQARVRMTADLRVPAETNRSIGFVLRFLSEESYILARVYSGLGAINPKLSILEVVNLVTTELDAFDIAISPGDTLTNVRVEVINDVITMTWDGNSVTATTTALNSSVRHGIFTGSSATAANRGWIDNLVIEGLIL